ncbi:hypothetical protein [Terribacillus saccharophilus]|uniref:Uncharacterized protein n=1 Tax=Terribacillus saccharophilus TaxID=361277 RepID=A0AAX2EFV4_9BACI|nr:MULTISPECIES: hypothetical protein [Terribacillus]MCM3225377.1 hypothetical protein [Terribacillus saccharophilus]MEC0281910.1 hypothetical protein [Terribacillus saccharophilus]MEC0291301.1 hypothetical protein [Terribacillus saccharophilus]MEC0301813.1 hypothetical protein [Terribacillus saccharophilus]SEN35398.1 hypothetical protein SAMN04489762_2032 [Terribacillus saccharophilus]
MISFLSLVDQVEQEMKRPSTATEYDFLKWMHEQYVAEQSDILKQAQ